MRNAPCSSCGYHFGHSSWCANNLKNSDSAPMSETTEQVAACYPGQCCSTGYCIEELWLHGLTKEVADHLASVLAARLDDGLAAKVLAALLDVATDSNWSPRFLAGWHRGMADAQEVVRALLDQPHTGTNP